MTQSGGRGDDAFWARPADGHGGIDDPTPVADQTAQPTVPAPAAPVEPTPVQPQPTQPPVWTQQPPAAPQPVPPPPYPPQGTPAPGQVPQDPYQQPPVAPPVQQAPWPQQPQPQIQTWQTGPAPRYPDIAANTQRSRRGGCLWMIILSVIATVALNYCARVISGIEVPTTEDTSTPHTVVILVTTTTPTDINWSVGSQAGTAPVKANWTRTVQTGGQKVVSVSAQTTGTKDTKISCEIKVDGKTIDTATVTKAGQLASCTGTTQ